MGVIAFDRIQKVLCGVRGRFPLQVSGPGWNGPLEAAFSQ